MERGRRPSQDSSHVFRLTTGELHIPPGSLVNNCPSGAFCQQTCADAYLAQLHLPSPPTISASVSPKRSRFWRAATGFPHGEGPLFSTLVIHLLLFPLKCLIHLHTSLLSGGLAGSASDILIASQVGYSGSAWDSFAWKCTVGSVFDRTQFELY